ncbi:NAD(P)-dependent oxidoreductase [uncultured Devosia sp.]|uniref:NAD-dependent epimerase/dehydratase family protein n=1 Tax=uncultured Devosia sp. TaxID=211434 RepID=UPI0026186D8A|nr:NAD(P)-dependent oxidoreductase [uncultured Devosia sp.]
MVGKSAVVFGGAGFVGSHLLKALVASGEYDRIVSGDIQAPRFAVEGVDYKHVDVTRPIPEEVCDTATEIYNLAAVHTTPGHPDWEYFWTNVTGATNCSDFARRVDCRKIVFTSSISVYGASEDPKDESSMPMPDSAYGRSKLCAEAIHAQWAKEDPGHRRLVVVRPAVIYGYTEGGNFTRLAHLMATGRFLFPGRTDTVKACGYVEDLIRSFRFALDCDQTHLVYNFAHAERFTSQTICDAFTAVAGYPRARRIVPISLMMLAGVGFEILSLLGIRSSINRARIRKLYRSTNIVPAKLAELGFTYSYDLPQSLRHWREMSGGEVFR